MLLRDAGNSPFAIRESLLTPSRDDGVNPIVGTIDDLSEIGKRKARIEIILKTELLHFLVRA